MNILLELGKFLISATVIGGIIIWLFKEYLKLRFSRDLENYKGKIDNHFYKEKLRYSKIYEERALVIKELYLILNKYHKSLRNNYETINNPLDFKGNKKGINADKSLKLAYEFEDCFDNNKILLDENLCNEIEKLKKIHLNILKKIVLNMLPPTINSTAKDATIELKKMITEDIPAIEIKLEEEFRKLLGSME